MRILLTGDDGYNSIGTRLLIHALSEKHKLTVVGTRTQQTAVGGKLSVRQGGTWGETTIDGVKSIWVDGTPADAMECAAVLFPNNFDLILSGVNLGENVTGAIVSSGTVSAVLRGMALSVAEKAAALSWMVPPEFFFKDHDEKEDLTVYLNHPGKMIETVVNSMIASDLWGAKILNINFPKEPCSQVRFTRFTPHMTGWYPPLIIRENSNTFAYPISEGNRNDTFPDTDIGALVQEAVSITPLTPDWTDYSILNTLPNTPFTI